MQKNMRETEGFFEMNDKNNKTVCFTGHREIENNSPESIAHVLNQTVRILISHGARRFLTGGALGFDTSPAKCGLGSERTYGHTGFTGTQMKIDPDNGLIFIFLSNRVSPTRDNPAFTRSDIRNKLWAELYK